MRGLYTVLRGRRGFVPAEEVAVAVLLGPGEQATDEGFGQGDIAGASDVVEVTAEAGEGVEAAAYFGDGHGVTSDGGVGMDGQDERDQGSGWENFWEIPPISAHIRSFE